jgi:hypothetical protein
MRFMVPEKRLPVMEKRIQITKGPRNDNPNEPGLTIHIFKILRKLAHCVQASVDLCRR